MSPITNLADGFSAIEVKAKTAAMKAAFTDHYPKQRRAAPKLTPLQESFKRMEADTALAYHKLKGLQRKAIKEHLMHGLPLEELPAPFTVLHAASIVRYAMTDKERLQASEASHREQAARKKMVDDLDSGRMTVRVEEEAV